MYTSSVRKKYLLFNLCMYHLGIVLYYGMYYTLILIPLSLSLEYELFSVIHCGFDDKPIEFLYCCLCRVSSIIVFVDLNFHLKFNDLYWFLGQLSLRPHCHCHHYNEHCNNPTCIPRWTFRTLSQWQQSPHSCQYSLIIIKLIWSNEMGEKTYLRLLR